MIAAYRLVFSLVPSSLKGLAGLALVFMLVNGLLEVMGVASVFPVMLAATSDPSKNPTLSRLYQLLGPDNPTQFVVLLGLGACLLFVLLNLCAALTLWLSSRFCERLRHHLSSRLLSHYLSRSYQWFLTRNSSELAKEVLIEVDNVVEHLVFGLALFTSYVISSTLILGALILVEPVVALSTLFVLAIVYHLVYAGLRRQLTSIGEKRTEANAGRFKAVTEGFGAVKEGRVFRGRESLAARYEKPSRDYCATEVSYQLMAELPRYATESLAVVAVLSVLLYLVTHNSTSAIPLLMLYITAIWRLVPALQSVYRNAVRIQFYLPALQAIAEQLKECQEPGWETRPFEPLPMTESLKLENIEFTYPESEIPALVIPELVLVQGETVALVGQTGGGKTTLADVVAGFLNPQKGVLSVDGQVLDAQGRARWRASLGYVPQEIYILDDTVSRNIALGVPANEVDPEAVEKAARTAQMHEFIVESLEQEYDTHLGERGARLSGGQRQRLGIARALYHDPHLLVLDEATSAVDTLTEQDFVKALESLSGSRTVVVVSHRLSSLRHCDRLCVLDEGRLVAKGTFDEVESFLPQSDGSP